MRVPSALRSARRDEVVDRLVAGLVERALRADVPAGPPPTVPARSTRGPRGPRGDVALAARADAVAARWLPGVAARRVTWSHRMQARWGSCTPSDGSVRISHRLASAPDAVLDNTLLHELAHLVEPGHDRAFQRLVAADPAAGQVAAWLAHQQRHALRLALGVAPAGGAPG